MSTGGYLFGAAVLVAAVAVIAPGLPEPQVREAPAQPSTADVPEPRLASTVEGEAQVLEREGDGHFYAEARVNGARIRFIVDTGASIVALTAEDARRAGIVPGDERRTARGAGGEIEVAPARIDRIELGAIAATDVDAVVAEDLPVSLLGQSFLSRVGRIELEGDRMALTE